MSQIRDNPMMALRLAAELYDPTTPVAPVNNSRYWFDDPDAIIAIHPDGSRIVTATADNTVRFWDPETEKELASIPMDAGVTNLTFTPDGTGLVIELDNGSARIFDTRSAEEQAADVQRRWAERVPTGEYLDTLMADPTALNDDGKPWAEDRIAQSLLAEGEALIGGGEGKPTE